MRQAMMTRDEAIAILARQPPEVREAAAVYCQTDTGIVDDCWLHLECARNYTIKKGELETLMPTPKCNQPNCPHDAMYRYAWPGQPEATICAGHAARLLSDSRVHMELIKPLINRAANSLLNT